MTRVRELPIWRVLVALLIVGMSVALYRQSGAVRQARIDYQNERAAHDRSKVVYRDQMHTVAERLAFQTSQNVQLSGELDRLLRRDGEKTRLLSRLTITFDSIRGLVSSGEVTGDSAVRYLFARIDTLGFHASVQASVPPPPDTALVHWHVSRDSVGITTAVNEGPEGQLTARTVTDAHATPSIDTTVVAVEPALRHNRRLAASGLLVLLGLVLGKLLLY